MMDGISFLGILCLGRGYLSISALAVICGLYYTTGTLFIHSAPVISTEAGPHVGVAHSFLAKGRFYTI
jgi:hypothetical protein